MILDLASLDEAAQGCPSSKNLTGTISSRWERGGLQKSLGI